MTNSNHWQKNGLPEADPQLANEMPETDNLTQSVPKFADYRLITITINN